MNRQWLDATELTSIRRWWSPFERRALKDAAEAIQQWLERDADQVDDDPIEEIDLGRMYRF